MRQKNRVSRKLILLILIILLFIGVAGGSITLFNLNEQKKDIKLEVTFVTPRQAIVFWKTTKKTVGYVTYGENERNLSQRSDQTSSSPSEIHAVVLNDIPLDGLFISIHNESDSIFLWHKPIQIGFDPTTIE